MEVKGRRALHVCYFGPRCVPEIVHAYNTKYNAPATCPLCCTVHSRTYGIYELYILYELYVLHVCTWYCTYIQSLEVRYIIETFHLPDLQYIYCAYCTVRTEKNSTYKNIGIYIHDFSMGFYATGRRHRSSLIPFRSQDDGRDRDHVVIVVIFE